MLFHTFLAVPHHLRELLKQQCEMGKVTRHSFCLLQGYEENSLRSSGVEYKPNVMFRHSKQNQHLFCIVCFSVLIMPLLLRSVFRAVEWLHVL